MKKSYITILLPLLFISTSSSSFGQSWDWIETANIHSEYSNGDVSGNHGVAVDNKGNVYAGGEYADTISFGADTLKGLRFGGIFLVKYNVKGKLRWVASTVNKYNYNYSSVSSVAVDKMGNVYTTGQFLDTLVIGSYTLTANASAFIAKYDSNGNLLWAKQGITPSSASSGGAYSIALDESGYAYIIGQFDDTISFGVYTLTTLSHDRPGSGFLIKYDPNGNVVWAKQANVASSESWAYPLSVTTDKFNNIFITGPFKDTVSFGAFTLKTTSQATAEVFLTKYNSNGNVLWAEESESASDGGASSCVAADGLGNCYVVGYVYYNLIFGKDTLTGNDNNFLVKYDVNGNVLWAEQGKDLGNSFSLGAGSVSCDTTKQGGGYVAFYGIGASNQLKFKFGGDTFNFNVPHQSATAIMHFDSSGKALCGTIFSEGNEDDGDAVGVDPTGTYVYFGGDLADTTILGADTFRFPLGSDVPIVARWSSCDIINTAGIANTDTPLPELKVYPNPSSGNFQLKIKNYESEINGIVEVYNILGEQVYSKPFLISNSSFLINLSNQPNGIYLYRVISQDGELIGSGKVIIEK